MILLVDNYDSFVFNPARCFRRLRHQAIAEALGGRVVRAAEPVHERTSLIHHDGRGIFAGPPNPVVVCRCHSLAVDEASQPACLTDSGYALLAAWPGCPCRRKSRPSTASFASGDCSRRAVCLLGPLPRRYTELWPWLTTARLLILGNAASFSGRRHVGQKRAKAQESARRRAVGG